MHPRLELLVFGMPILYPLAQGTIVLCNYNSGFRVPEMQKVRPAIIVSPRLSYRDKLCAVVPLSGTPPERDVAYAVRLDLDLPPPWGLQPRWAKADMVATVCFDRLDMFRTERDRRTGQRKYLHPKLNLKELKSVQVAILHGLGLGSLTEHL